MTVYAWMWFTTTLHPGPTCNHQIQSYLLVIGSGQWLQGGAAITIQMPKLMHMAQQQIKDILCTMCVFALGNAGGAHEPIIIQMPNAYGSAADQGHSVHYVRVCARNATVPSHLASKSRRSTGLLSNYYNYYRPHFEQADWPVYYNIPVARNWDWKCRGIHEPLQSRAFTRNQTFQEKANCIHNYIQYPLVRAHGGNIMHHKIPVLLLMCHLLYPVLLRKRRIINNPL